MRLDLAPHLLNRVEIRRVSGQEPDFRSRRSDELLRHRGLVWCEIVHHDDVALGKSRAEDPFHIGAEYLGIGGSANRHASGAANHTDRGDHRGGAPMAAKCRGVHPLPAQARYVVFCAALVDKDELCGIEASWALRHSLLALRMSARSYSEARSVFLYRRQGVVDGWQGAGESYGITQLLQGHVGRACKLLLHRLLVAFGDDELAGTEMEAGSNIAGMAALMDELLDRAQGDLEAVGNLIASAFPLS